MRIELKYLSGVFDKDGNEITDTSILRQLDGVVDNVELSQYLESEFEDIGFSDGFIKLSVEGDSLYSTVTYYSERLLDSKELHNLTESTNGQMIDGYGESPLELNLSGQQVFVEFACIFTDTLAPRLNIKQIDDGSKSKKAPRSPIFSAIEKGDIAKARKYLMPEHLSSLDKWEFTPLMIAIRKGHFELALEMIEAGANVHHVSKYSGASPLSVCAMAGDVRVCKKLVELGVDINKQKIDPDGFTNGYTALFWSANRGHEELTKYLINSGANVNVIAEDGSTALKLAKKHSIVEILLENGADPKYLNKSR